MGYIGAHLCRPNYLLSCQLLCRHKRRVRLGVCINGERRFSSRVEQGNGMASALQSKVAELRETFHSGKTKEAAWRKSQLRAILKLLQEEESEICRALEEDLGKHPVESYRDEVGLLAKSVKNSLQNLDGWMAKKKVEIPFVAFPTTGQIVPEPLGLVLIFSSWNFPFGLALEPFIGAIAAGNVVVLKPSELAPASSSLLSRLIPVYLDQKAVLVIEGGSEIGQELLESKWDKIFFTGSGRVGRIVMSAAAEHLTPVTLELGGKCPALLDSLESLDDAKVAAKRIVGGKWGPCNGQACVAIDYVVVEDKFVSTLVDFLRQTIKKFYGDNPKELKHIANIVNKQHYMRLKGLLQDPNVAASIVHGGSLDDRKLFIEPTILLNPPLDADIMSEEIFGPLLPIITVKNIEDSIEFVNSRPKPLAIYVFTKDEHLKDRVIKETSSGSVTFNDALVQFALDTLPFGGVGESGFGRYRGKFSFDTFSHEKAILRRNFTDINFRYPPWNDLKLQFIRAVYSYNYVRLILLLLGWKK